MQSMLCLALLCARWGVTGLLALEAEVETTNAQEESARAPPTTAQAALHQLWSSRGGETCIAGSDERDAFSNPANSLSTQLRPGGRLFLIGDEVTGHLCEFGKPGLCCSNARPCEGALGLHGQARLWEDSMDRMGWRQLKRHAIRSRGNTAVPHTQAYTMGPVPPIEPDQVHEVIARIKSFLGELRPTEKDVMVLGLMSVGPSQSLNAFANYTLALTTDVINTFPGRAVILSSSPKHPWQGETGACALDALPGELHLPTNTFQNAIFVYNVWRELTNHRARLIDVQELLRAMSPCHKGTQCAEWNDPTISMVVQLVLDSLQKIQ